MLTINIAATDSQASVNEDVAGHHGNAAWVIDGATGVGAALLEAPSDAAWLARTIDAAFRRLLADDPMIATEILVRQAILVCRDALHAGAIRSTRSPHEHPSAAFAMLRAFDDHVELTGLADCSIVYVDHDDIVRMFSDTSFDAIESRTLGLVRQLLASEPEIEPLDLFERLRPQLRANRLFMNRPGGYWVLGTEPAAADHLARRTLPFRAGQRFALASDGFLRLIDMFAVARPSDLLAIDGMDAWKAWLDRLRAIEREPGSRARHARVKIHDDATFLNLDV